MLLKPYAWALTVTLPFCFMYQAATTLSKATLAKHTATKTTLPEDLHYDADKLFRLFIKLRIMVSNKTILTEFRNEMLYS